MRIFTICLITLLSQVHTSFCQTDIPFHNGSLKFNEYMDLVGKHNLDYAAERYEVSKAEAAIEIARIFPDPDRKSTV